MIVEREQHRSQAPAAGCFGLARAPESYDGASRQHSEGELSDWERYAARFCVIDYGDGQPVKEAPRTS